MAFRATKFNLAARLLLAPIVAGTATSAVAQSQPGWRAPGMPAPTAPAMTKPTAPAVSPNAAPRDLLKQGRKALSGNQLDAAQEFCVKAEQAAAAQKYNWGIFEDTPTNLRKDITEARLKADKVQASQLLKEAKELWVRKTANDAERLANLDLALAKAQQAESLHGPYSMLDMDKPGALIRDIKASQETLRRKSGVAANPKGAASAPETVVTMAPAAKSDVLRIVAEGRTLLAQDKVLEAKAKGDAARKLAEEKGLLHGFAVGEDTPDLLITACRTKGNEMVKTLLSDCDQQLSMGAVEKAEAACTLASQVCSGLGLYSKPVDDKRSAIAKLKMPATTTVASVSTPSMPVPSIPTPTFPAASPMAVEQARHTILLQQAANELKNGSLDTARTLAMQAYNADPAAKAEATAIIRQIDIEIAGRKRAEAATAFNNALAVYGSRDYARALPVLQKIDPTHLNAEQKSTLEAALAECQARVSPIKLAGATDDDLKKGINQLNQDLKSATAPVMTPAAPPITAPVAPPPSTTPVDSDRAAADIAFDKLRSEAIEVMKAAGDAWSKGETDACMKVLEEFTAKVKASSVSPPRQAMLLKPIDARLQGYARMKHNYDFELKEAREKIETKNRIIGERIAEAQKQDEIKKKFQEISTLQEQGKFAEAELLAAQVANLDPDDPACKAIHEAAKYRRRMEDNKRWAKEDEQFNLDVLNDAERRGPAVTLNNPLHVDPQRALIAARRGSEGMFEPRTQKERILEGKLSASYPLLKFENMPLREALNQIRKQAKINITVDDPTLEDEKLSLDTVIINEELADISLDSALKILLSKARLVHIIENDVVTITTEKRTKGRMKTKVFHVMDLVTPIPEYKLQDHHTLGGAMAASKQLPWAAAAGMGSPTPVMGGGGMTQGTLVSGTSGAGTASTTGGSGGQLVNNLATGPNAMTPQRTQYAEQLKKLITNMVRQGTWAENGTNGGGTIAYYDIGGAMVVNQTADVISEVEALLNSLRRLQDLSVAVEIRVVSLSETYFERIGVDFQANITTNNTSFERSLATGQFRPEPFLNSLNGVNGVTTGWSPATGFTSDLGIPIRPSSYNLTAPPFGNYQTSLSPTLNGGLSLGLAFLNDIQVYMFLEAAAGNSRINIMQAPKITLFNGQTSTVFVGDLAYFATGLQVYSANGQFIYLPVNQSFPIGQGFNPNGTGTGTSSGVSVTVQAVISADRRFVRLNLTPSLTALASATVPLYPITTFITPVFEGGSQGQPIPFTQFFQQPSFTEISAQTTVAIPDGGTVLLGGLKTMAQGRNEFGPPVLSHIPYLNRLFKNVGIGQETRHVMLMVTPRIIINSEEEARQTGEGIGGALPPQ